MNSVEQVLVQGRGGSPNPLDKDGLCLLSLDGGGVRGISSLYILKNVMEELNETRKEARP
jgi:hypothetical protein